VDCSEPVYDIEQFFVVVETVMTFQVPYFLKEREFLGVY
jgi:hypothetical protein